MGVALKLAMAINGPEGDGDVLAEYGDLAAVGTVADVMRYDRGEPDHRPAGAGGAAPTPAGWAWPC